MAALAGKMLARNSGKLGKLAQKVPGLPAALPGASAALGGVTSVPEIPVGPGMQAPIGTPVTGRVHTGSLHKRIYWPGTKGDPQPEEPPEPIWTPTSVTGMATAAAVTGGGVAVVTKSPSLFATWAPTVAFIFGVLLILGMVIYYTFFNKGKKPEED